MPKSLIILEPAASAAVTVSGMGGSGNLCHASGVASGAFIAEIKALCEPVATSTTPGTKTPAQVKTDGKSAYSAPGGSWSASHIPGARFDDVTDQWNILHVCTFYYGFPAAPTNHETRYFKGVGGTCSSSMVGGVRGIAAVQQLVGQQDAAQQCQDQQNAEQEITEPQFASLLAQAGITGLVSRLSDLIDMWWDRDVNAASRREPADRDGDWLLYRNLPVDIPFGVVLGLDGSALRASSISVAAESISIRRKLAPPIVHVAAPQGTGLPAVNSGGLLWRFPGYGAFGSVIHQPPRGPHLATTQPIHSACRECPTDMYLDRMRPIRFAVNSPETQDFLNEGHVDLWVRVNSL